MSADIRPIRTAAEQGLAETFAAARGKLPGAAEQRAAAFRRFESDGLPHRRVEEWKYTDLRALMRDAKPLAGAPDTAAIARARKAERLLAGLDAQRLVFVDGAFVPDLSDLAGLDAGLTVVPMARALAAGDPQVVSTLGTVVPTDDVAVALNTAFMGDGAVIRVAEGAVIARPIHLQFIYTASTAAALFTRSLIVVGKGAHATIMESHEGPDELDYQVNHAVELVVGEDAQVDHAKVGREGSRALHVSTLMAALGERAQLRDLSFTTGGGVARHQIFLRFNGKDARATIGGATLLKSRQHVDTTLVVDHVVAGGTSRELFKAVLDDESRSVFQGKIIVRPGAQKTDGRMMTQALLLSELAEADNKPELEIFADDVQCGHGATAGALDENHLFYLTARGISRPEAEALLIQAFVGEAIETVPHEGLRDILTAAAVKWLDSRQ